MSRLCHAYLQASPSPSGDTHVKLYEVSQLLRMAARSEAKWTFESYCFDFEFDFDVAWFLFRFSSMNCIVPNIMIFDVMIIYD